MDEDGGEWSRGNSHRHSYGSDSDSDPGSDDDTFADEEFDETAAQSSSKSKKKKKKKPKSDSKSKSKKKKKKDEDGVKSPKSKKKKKSKESLTAVNEDEEGERSKSKTPKSPKKKKKSKENVVDDDGDVATPKRKKKHSKKEKSRSNGEVDEPPMSPRSSKSPKKKSKKKDKKEKKSKKEKQLGLPDEPVEELLAAAAAQQEQVHFVDDPVDENKDDDSQAERMKSMLAQWDDSDSDDSPSDSSDEEELDAADEEENPLDKKMTKDEMGLRDGELDHVILAAPDYEEAVKEFETMTGIKPARMGGLKGLGIRAARVATDNNCYIEILAPDPVKAGPIGAKLAELEEGTLIPYHYAIRESDLDELQDEFVPNELGYVPDRINLFSPSPDGMPAKWGMLFMQGHFIGGVVPYYVDWGGCAHPLSSIPTVGPLKSLNITAPGGSQVHNILKNVDMVTTQQGDPAMEFSIGTPEGTITFSGENPLGLVFPGTSFDSVCD